MTIAREEIFGPVLCVMAYEDENEAINIANDSDYGLQGYVFSSDPERARAVASQLLSGAKPTHGNQFKLPLVERSLGAVLTKARD